MVTAEGGRLLERGELLAERSELTEGYVQPTRTGALVRLRGREKRFDLRVGRTTDAHEILHGLHLDANEARVTFWAPSPVVSQPAWQVLFIAAWAILLGLLGPTAHTDTLSVSFAPLVVAYFFALLVPTRIVTGPDGLRVGWLGPGRFVPYSSITSITSGDDEVRAHRSSGRATVIKFKPPRWASRNDWFFEWLFRDQKAALYDRLTEGLAQKPAATPADVETLLSRGGRATSEWLAALRSLGAVGLGGYRSASVPRELLWSIAESPSAAPDARVAAAVALRGDLDREGRERLRVAAAATVAPKLRVALGNVLAEGPDEEEKVSLALADAEEEARERKRRA
jgi:hypothetical protein